MWSTLPSGPITVFQFYKTLRIALHWLVMHIMASQITCNSSMCSTVCSDQQQQQKQQHTKLPNNWPFVKITMDSLRMAGTTERRIYQYRQHLISSSVPYDSQVVHFIQSIPDMYLSHCLLSSLLSKQIIEYHQKDGTEKEGLVDSIDQKWVFVTGMITQSIYSRK